ncbi:MAG: hypothetical protein AAB209_07850 [Bacteroidota bacterium]|jgi:hypothetical protein
MSKVEEIQSTIQTLSDEEFAQLRNWLAEQDAEKWDKQFEADVRAGKLDKLADEALRRHANGESTPL